MVNIKKGDFSALAKDYTKYRPSYNEMIVDFIFGATNKNASEIDAADVGAGTGIFVKLLVRKNIRTLYAVEPNDNMRKEGEGFVSSKVKWVAASAENTTLPENSFDIVSMASSFHWTDTQRSLAEFNRILRSTGVFVAAWNPRITELSKIEDKITKLLSEKYGIHNRVSSGRSGITINLTEILMDSKYFCSVAYCDAMDIVNVSPEHYVGAWRSVNDIRSQLGEEVFIEFINDVKQMTSDLTHIDVHYLTRAWIARK